MFEIALDMYQTAALAMLLFLLGRFVVSKSAFLQRCCVPAPVVGGLIFAIAHLVLYGTGLMQLSFDETVKGFFMTLFFTSVGYTACFRLLRAGGAKVVKFLGIAILVMILQNIIGAILAGVFGWDMRLGLCTGSIPMVGGHGTAGSYGPLMEEMGLTGANVLAVAAATYGLVAGSLMGGPVATSLIKKYKLSSTAAQDGTMEEDLPVAMNAEQSTESYTMSMILLIIAAGLGTILTNIFNGISFFGVSFTFPGYIGAMVVAAVIRNIADANGKDLPLMPINVWGNVSLSIFLAIALMTLKLWQLASLAGPMIVMLAAQTVLMFIMARFIVFKLMGSDYESAVMCSAMCGFGMGATPNAMANMQVLTKKYGPAPQAYFIVPLVGSLFADFCNGIIITVFLNVLPMLG